MQLFGPALSRFIAIADCSLCGSHRNPSSETRAKLIKLQLDILKQVLDQNKVYGDHSKPIDSMREGL